jgi:hypothetical protein
MIFRDRDLGIKTRCHFDNTPCAVVLRRLKKKVILQLRSAYPFLLFSLLLNVDPLKIYQRCVSNTNDCPAGFNDGFVYCPIRWKTKYGLI